jgi:hypothetical protein
MEDIYTLGKSPLCKTLEGFFITALILNYDSLNCSTINLS